MSSQPALELSRIVKRFGPVVAVDNISFSVAKGEMFALLGPSGCGKTTTLRVIAGFEQPDRGEIYLSGRLIMSTEHRVFVPPEKRNMGMVFQSYAVWPHLTVFENVAYPLRVRKERQNVVRDKVMEMLELVRAPELAERPATQLSGGQQQRVALARALIHEPEVVLLDEPFSNLDAKLREEMRLELKVLQQRIGFTAIFVTHDQSEAMSLSDRMMVMYEGRSEQMGSPEQLYDRPTTPIARDFIGKMIILRARLSSSPESDPWEVQLAGGGGSLEVSSGQRMASALSEDAEVVLAMRPEAVQVTAEPPPGNNVLEAATETALFMGNEFEYRLRLGQQVFVTRVPRSQRLTVGRSAYLRVSPEDVTVWPI